MRCVPSANVSSDPANPGSPRSRSEDQFRLLADRGQDVVYRLRLVPEPTLEYISPAATKLTGYTPEELYADPGLWRRLVHPDDRLLIDRASAVPPDPAAVEQPVVARWIRRDGSVLWTEHRSVPVFDASGAVVAIEGVSRDVTQRVEAEQRLRASEARFRDFLADIDLGALMLDASGAVVFINELLVNLLERTREELLGQDWIDVAVPEAEREALRQVFHEAIETGSLTGSREDSVVTASGRHRRLSWTSVTQRDADGNVVGLASIAHDVTELHRVEAERTLLSAAVEQTAEAIIVTDPAGQIVFVNPAFERVSGYSRDEVLGQNPRLLQAPSQDPTQFKEMWSALGAGEAWQGELANRRKDGSDYTDAVTITPIVDDHGQLSAFMSVQRDVSHLREVEADLSLEARVRVLLAESIQVATDATGLEDAAAALCSGLASMAEIDVVHVVAFLGDGEGVVLAACAPVGFPIKAGDWLPVERARYLLEHSTSGPWGERMTNTTEGDPIGAAMRAMGIEALAFGPIKHGDAVGGVVVVGTRDTRSAALVAEKMPALVGFGASANTHLVERLRARRAEVDMRRAIETVLRDRAFRTVFQPIVELESGEHIGYEALTRFESGERPDTCFGHAWSVGLGPELELATLDAALDSARELPAGRWLSLNVSPRLLAAPDQLATALGAAGRPIVLEITEHEKIVDYAAIRNAVRAFRNGVRLAVDDAGVGIANFGHIVELRPDLVKIDISLVRGVDVDLGRQALVVAMRHFARTSGCRLLAEGVETKEEAQALTQLGVEFGQGYWFGRPEAVERWAAGQE